MIGFKIGDRILNTELHGDIEILDVYISPTTQERVYRIRTIKIRTDGKEEAQEAQETYLVEGGDLQ